MIGTEPDAQVVGWDAQSLQLTLFSWTVLSAENVCGQVYVNLLENLHYTQLIALGMQYNLFAGTEFSSANIDLLFLNKI